MNEGFNSPQAGHTVGSDTPWGQTFTLELRVLAAWASLIETRVLIPL